MRTTQRFALFASIICHGATVCPPMPSCGPYSKDAIGEHNEKIIGKTKLQAIEVMKTTEREIANDQPK